MVSSIITNLMPRSSFLLKRGTSLGSGDELIIGTSSSIHVM